MTRRTYVKPEWHAMGMPVAAAAPCPQGAGVVGVEAVCSVGTTADYCAVGNGADQVTPCNIGQSALACGIGTSPRGPDCFSGSSARTS